MLTRSLQPVIHSTLMFNSKQIINHLANFLQLHAKQMIAETIVAVDDLFVVTILGIEQKPQVNTLSHSGTQLT